MMLRCCVLTAMVAVLGLWPQGRDESERPQEPQQKERPPQAPADAPPLRPVEEKWIERVPRDDLPERHGVRDPLEGVWRLRSRSVEGVPTAAGAGYMAIGRHLMMVQFEAPGSDPDIALLRAGTYEWQRTGEADAVRTRVLIGHFNDAGGDVHVEVPGHVELRQFELLDSALRIHQENGDWLEFVRVE